MPRRKVLPSTYQFNIRSFHPEKDFGWSGLMFEGDSRGFSLRESGKGIVTSRIWQKFSLNLETQTSTQPTTHSDLSKAPWKDTYQTYDRTLKPRGRLQFKLIENPITQTQHYRIIGSYGGENHAMPSSVWLKENLGITYVPTLNVGYTLLLDFNPTQGWLDIVTYISGDGFPNCEAFVVDHQGTAVFLGIHVRKGAAPISLALNTKYPMIASAIRLPLKLDGSFSGSVGNEYQRVKQRHSTLNFTSISSWNQKFLKANPNNGHCMLLERASLDGCFGN